ncbi:MAG TPA: NAD-dependent epimerase/dehydratase family protein, partial [Bdellovibrionota bacterium]|nr:NAD-dependent epimerase/dehydratase family protein [Bdellovibrionota bacterium]
INTNVLSMAAEYKVSRLISCLSSCCYQYYDDRFSTEDDLHLGLPFGGNLGYGCAKRMLDIHTSLLNEQYGCSFTTITPATMYGPNDNWDLEDGHVVGSLIHKCFLAKERNVPLVVWGSGNAVRQFVFSYDIARVTIEALDVDWGPKTMIVAPDHGSSIGELALKIAKATGFKGKLVFDSTKPEGARARVLESKLFRKYFPKFSFTPLDEGLTMAAEWFLRHFKNELLSDKHHASVSL